MVIPPGRAWDSACPAPEDWSMNSTSRRRPVKARPSLSSNGQMANPSHISFNANDRSYLAIVKKEIHQLAVQAGFEQKKINEIDIIVSELGSNLIKHASGGEILAGILPAAEGVGL